MKKKKLSLALGESEPNQPDSSGEGTTARPVKEEQ